MNQVVIMRAKVAVRPITCVHLLRRTWSYGSPPGGLL